MRLKISEIQEADKTDLRTLYLEVRKKHFTWENINSFTLSSFDLDTTGELILVAKINKKIVGFISSWLPDNFIHHLYIDSDHQGKGIGSQVLNEMIQKLQSPIILKCVKTNKSAIRFYLKNGWHPKKEKSLEEKDYILFEYVK